MRFTFSGTVHCGTAPPHRDFGADVTSGATIPGETPQPRNHATWCTPAPVTRPRRQEPPTPTHRATARSQAHLLSAGLAPRNTVRAHQVGPRGGKTTSRNLLESNLHIAMFSLNNIGTYMLQLQPVKENIPICRVPSTRCLEVVFLPLLGQL